MKLLSNLKLYKKILLYKTSFNILIFLFLTSCSGPPGASNVNLQANPNANAPLAGILSLIADRPVIVTLLIDDGEKQQVVTPDSTYATAISMPVLGLNPDKDYQVTATIKDQEGRKTKLETLTMATPPLPEDFPKITLTQSKSGTLEPGITMFDVFRWEATESDKKWGYAIAIDEKGEVVWYLKNDYNTGEPRRLQNGNIIVIGGVDGRLFEVNMLGNLVQEWNTSGGVINKLAEGSIPVQTDKFHHDVLALNSGNFLGLGLEVYSLDDFPAEYPPSAKREATNIAGDVIMEFDRDGNTIRKWKVKDILDIERLGEGSLSRGHYKELYIGKYDPVPYDVTHSNAIYYIEDEDAVLVSSFRQCVIYKVDMKTGELKWMLGDPYGWKAPWSEKLLKPQGNMILPYHQHGLEMTPQGTILMFDNGGTRRIPPQKEMPEEERFSRAVEFRVDETAGTVEELWSYGPEQEHFLSPFISDADYLPETGNILITDGGRKEGSDDGYRWGRILEVTHDKNPKKLWEVHIKDPEVHYSVYRAQRFLSLYPKLDRPTG